MVRHDAQAPGRPDERPIGAARRANGQRDPLPLCSKLKRRASLRGSAGVRGGGERPRSRGRCRHHHCRQLLRRPAVCDPRSPYVHTPRRMTVGGARNTGLGHVTTPYVYFQDADDLMGPGTLRRLQAELEAHPEAVLANGPVYVEPTLLRLRAELEAHPEAVPGQRPGLCVEPADRRTQAHLPAPLDDADLAPRAGAQDLPPKPPSLDPLHPHGHEPREDGGGPAQRRLSERVVGRGHGAHHGAHPARPVSPHRSLLQVVPRAGRASHPQYTGQPKRRRVGARRPGDSQATRPLRGLRGLGVASPPRCLRRPRAHNRPVPVVAPVGAPYAAFPLMDPRDAYM